MEELYKYLSSKTSTINKKYVALEPGIINVTMPNKYSELPDLPGLHVVDYLKKYTHEELCDYFDCIFDGYAEITVINDIFLDSSFCCYSCEFCHDKIQDGSKYYYCTECYIDICDLCYHEADKISDKNYDTTKHNLCFRELYPVFCCNICSNEMRFLLMDDFKHEQMYSNYDELKNICSNVCVNCAETKKGKELIENDKLKLVSYLSYQLCDQANFGSMLDWIPIFQGIEEAHTILLNCNPDSKYHSRLALLAGDDHGRTGYYVLQESISLADLLIDLEKLHNEAECKTLDGFYNHPIKLYMRSLGMQIHYG